MIANVHSIETFSSVDGPGIRYVLFLQGCNMFCKFCHNIDTTVKTDNRAMTVDEVVEDFLKYKAFYIKGGITVSGGEPFLQTPFIIELFTKFKELGVHTAIETQGSIYRDIPMYDELIEITDLFIVDLKGVNNTDAKFISGVKIDNTFKMLEKLDSLNKKFLITYVLLPEVNNSSEHARQMANILNRYNPKNFDFKVLGYHKLGLEKWNKLDFTYELDHVREATKDDIRLFLDEVIKYQSIK